MNKTTRILVIGGALATAAGAAYLLIPAIKKLAANMRQLQLILEDIQAAEEDEPEEDYRATRGLYPTEPMDIQDPEVLRRVDEALKQYPDGWVTRERPVRHTEPEEKTDDESRN